MKIVTQGEVELIAPFVVLRYSRVWPVRLWLVHAETGGLRWQQSAIRDIVRSDVNEPASHQMSQQLTACSSPC